MTKRGLLLWLLTVGLLTSAVPSWGAPGTSAGPKAGTISALLPVAKITRGSGKKAVITEAKKGDELVWNDLVKTEKGGRARITLVDQSILSLGSQAELRIVKHDARSQQTTLEMAYGRVRAQVASITRDGGSFELRTPTAVAGVIGTDFGVDSSSVGGDTFVCLAGAVQIANSNKTVAGSVQCTTGQTTTVQPGKPPSPPQPATAQQIQQLIADTEPAVIASISPAGGLPGNAFDSMIAGQNMAKVSAVGISGTGVTATLKSVTATGVQIHVVVAANAPAGPRTITLSKPTGASSATFFTVLGPPSTTDPKSYQQTLQQLAQTGESGLGGFLTGAQQTADGTAQQVTDANLNLPKPIDLTQFATALNQLYGTLQTAVTKETATVQTSSVNASAKFQSSYDEAYKALALRSPSATPDAAFKTAVQAAFQLAQNEVQGTITSAQSTLTAGNQTFGTGVSELGQQWMDLIKAAAVAQGGGPTPKVNAFERDVNLGDVASFDAAGSAGTNGASLASTSWVLCAPSYQPGGFGTPLPSTTTACNAMAGFASTESEFDIPTCTLTPGTYFARLTLTDSNGKITPMDVKMVIAAPSYGTPTQTVRAVADAYSSLQLSPFLSLFDSDAPGNSQLFLNMQKTLPMLSSMNINLISSQDSVTCNDAVTRAAWQQNYTFKGSGTVLTNTEQLSVYMHRTPGTGWLITNLVGDNGTVQGFPAGPIATDAATADLQLSPSSVTLDGAVVTPSTTVSFGTHTITANIMNIGNAAFTSANWHVTFSAMDASGQSIAPDTEVSMSPIAVNGSVAVTGTLVFPKDVDNDVITLTVNANPDCGASIQEKSCSNNQQTFKLTVQNNVITFANVTPALSISPGGPAGIISMDVSSTIYPVQICSSVLSGITISSSRTGAKPSDPGGSPVCKSLTGPATLTFSFITPVGTPPSVQTDVFTATNAGNPTQGVPPATATISVPVTVAVADYEITQVTFTGHTLPYTGANALQEGETTTVVARVANKGNASPSGNITVTATCGDPAECTPITTTVAAPAAGSFVDVSGSVGEVSLPIASYVGTAKVTTDIVGAELGPAFTLPFDVVDFTFTANEITPAQNLFIGGSGTLSFALAETVPEGSTFGIPITPVAGPTLQFVPATQTTVGTSIPFTVNVLGGTPPTPSPTSPDLITVNATNHGVTKSVTVPVNYFNAQLVPQNLFANDAADPLAIPDATSAGAPATYPNLSLRMTGNYIGGTAGLTVVNPSCGAFSDNPFPTSAVPGDIIDFPIFGAVGNTCPAASQVVIQASIPYTNPPLNQTVYTLFVSPKGLPQLQVLSATPSRSLTSQPWLSGEPIDWTIQIKNSGSGPSAGNETVQLSLNGSQVGSAQISGVIAAGATGTLVVHTDAPDMAIDAPFGPTANLLVHVVLDTQGDLSPGTGDLNMTVNVSNWSITVSGAGVNDSNPLMLTVGGTTSGTANVIVNPLTSGSFNPGLTLPLVLGSYSSNQLNPSSMSPAMLSASGGSTVTVSIQGGLTPLTGSYFAQVIAQMKDGGTVTTQRQATVHVYITNPGAYSTNINLTSDQNNIAACPTGECGTPPSALQINGPLPDAFTLTATPTYCPGGSCPGTIDVSFAETFATVTTPQIATITATSPGNTLPVRVKATTNSDGTVNTGPASVFASVTAIQVATAGGARQPTPDPVGSNQFTMAFNIGDIYVASSSCLGILPQSTTPTPLSLSWSVYSGFNVSSISWEWEDSNHLPVGASPLGFSVSSGTSTYSSGTYSALPTFKLSNVSTGVDGLQTYFFAVTVSNPLASATKYFPFTFDLSQGQTFCPAAGGARGSGGGTLIRGSWGKAGLLTASSSSLKSGKLPDLRINPADVSFTPSMPKAGDMVNVRFRISNVGDVNALGVPVALEVNGDIVASDKFDVAVGKTTLGGLQWTNAKAPTGTTNARTMMRPVRNSRATVPGGSSPLLTSLQAALVIDPMQTLQQKTKLGKSVPLAHLSVHDAGAAAASSVMSMRQRAVLEIGDGGCAGIRFSGGASSCGGADVSVTVQDLAKGVYTLEAANGIADLGMGQPQQYTNANFRPQALGQNGHTYAVQLRGGAVGLFTLAAVRNPNQLNAAAQRVFHGGPAAKVVSKVGKTTAAPEPQTTQDSKVYFDILYQGQ